MKQKVFFILALLLGLLVPQGTKAYSFSSVAPTGQTLYYNIFGSTVEVIYPSSYSNGSSYSGYTRPSGDLEIPSSVTHNGTTYSVTRIGNYAFLYCSGLTSVTIPNSVTSIGHNAFAGCWGLTSITIPNSVTSIGNCAFSGCSGLTGALTIPNSVTSIGIYAFSGCSGLTSVTIPNSVTSIGTSAFKMVKNVIYGGSLAGCPWGGNTCNGYIEDSLIYSDATKTVLTGCLSNIIFANIPSSVISIGNYAFSGCSGLRSVTIPNSVTNIGSWAFACCSGLTTLNYYADSCGGNGFVYDTNSHWLAYTSLTTLNIGNNVRVIPDFFACDLTGLTSITIPNSVTSIGNYAFYGCSGLTTLNFNADSCGGYGFSTNYHWLSGCTALDTVNIGNNVRIIPDYFARGLTGLTSLTIPNSVTSIGQSAFSGCSGMTSVTIPNSVISIGGSAFSGCSGLTILNFNADSCGGNGFSTDYHWLSGCTALATVNIGNNVRIIPDYFARGLTGLTSLTIPNSVTSIGQSAFSGCSGMISVTIPNSVTSIGERAFYNCSGLTSVTIPNSVTSIEDYTFYGCSGLTSVTIPNSVTSIGQSAFSGCSGLTSVTIGNSVNTIPSEAFKNCTGLQVLHLSSALQYVGAAAFYNCDHLNTIYSLNPTPATVANSNAFENVWKGLPLIVPAGSRNAYAIAYGWREFTNIQEGASPISTFTVTATANDATMGYVTGGGSYTSGATATLTATANSGYHFVQWNDGNTTNPRTVTVTADATYTAIFAPDQSQGQFTVTATANDATMGYVTGGGSYNSGETATLTATANTGYHFVIWNDGVTTNPRTITVTADVTYTAIFAPLQGIEDAVYDGVSMKSVEGRIVIDGADGQGVTLTDIQGRTLYRGTATEQLTIDVPATGIYLLQLDGRPAKRIAVVR